MAKPHYLKLSTRAALWAFVLASLRREQTAGTIPPWRDDPTGEEQIAFVGPIDAPHAFAVYFAVDEQRIWVDLLIVDPAHRGKGFAKALLAAIGADADTTGHRRVELGTGLTNLAMQSAARSVGFDTEAVIMVRSKPEAANG